MHDLKQPLSHYEYIRAISLAWLDQKNYWTKKKTTTSSSAVSQSSDSSFISRLRSADKPVVTKSVAFTNKSLDAYSGALRCRLDKHHDHLPIRGENKVNTCQLCYWKSKSRVRAQVMKCTTCQIYLCLDCFKPFHEVFNLESLRTQF